MDQKIKDKIDVGYILCRSIIEVAGTPKEHIEKTIKLVVETIKNQKGIILASGDVFKTKEVELKELKEKGKLFSTYAELELLFKDVPTLIGYCFDYMPSSLEILEPKDLRFDTNGLAGLLNDLIAKLHSVDMILKNLRAENKILNDNASNILRNIIILSLSGKPKNIEVISKDTGIPGQQLKPFMDIMIQNKKVNLEKDVYSLVK